MKNFSQLLIGALIIFLSGCASVPMATLEQDAKAKDFSALPDKGVVYIYNNSSSMSLAESISVNGKVVGSITGNTYFRFNLIPGKYIINSFASYGSSSVDLNVEAGKNYFVWQELHFRSTTLEQVNETEGHKGVLETKLIAATASDDELNATVNNKDSGPSVSQKLRDLQSLRKDGVITEDEYQNKKQDLLKTF
jgi:hypothetical protein